MRFTHRNGDEIMSRLTLKSENRAQAVIDNIYDTMRRRIAADPPGVCPVDMAHSFVLLCHTQSCGKCTPCRIGLGQIKALLTDILDGSANEESFENLKSLCKAIVESADCVIGKGAASLVLDSISANEKDFISHIEKGVCSQSFEAPVPCSSLCPANVDIPGYISLISEGRLDDAALLIRKDNPWPIACAYICEHPCESHCRRSMMDAPINIRGLKRYAVDNEKEVKNPAPYAKTGKKVAVVGGGPAGLTAAYYLTIMGHEVELFESHKKLGGMLRYGIPSYRFPRELIDREIENILSVGINVHTETKIGRDITLNDLCEQYDALYISIGSQGDKKVGMEGEDSKGVMSAVELLGAIGDGEMPDFTGKNVVIIGGGNVAMDATRTSVRLGAKKVTCVYRRRMVDMTALPEEVEGALAEGAEILELESPVRIEVNENGEATALISQPQIIGPLDRAYRPRPNNANLPERRIPADIIILAIGQNTQDIGFEEMGIETKWGNVVTNSDTSLPSNPKIFSGGDCVSGPATAIKAVAAGKIAAANIDNFLGFNHEISVDVEIPAPKSKNTVPHGRVNILEREASERKGDFVCIENEMTAEQARCEADRCLRCDHFGYGCFRGGRESKW